jgi:cyclophilin family peptidyl-prolyl cis-trans isomerase
MQVLALCTAMVAFGCSSPQQGDSSGTEAPAGGETASAPSESPSGGGDTAPAPAPAATPAIDPANPPVIVVETSRGTFEFETYPQDAPKTVAHIVSLVNKRFYNGQRVHRVEPGFVIQFGDPLSRDMREQYRWGTGGSGSPVGAAEIKRPHRAGAVAMAHAGDARYADSQMYVSLSTERTRPLDGGYTVFGQVTSGMDVVQKIQALDTIKRMSVKAPSDAAK